MFHDAVEDDIVDIIESAQIYRQRFVKLDVDVEDFAVRFSLRKSCSVEI